jgi:hypothetical protein
MLVYQFAKMLVNVGEWVGFSNFLDYGGRMKGCVRNVAAFVDFWKPVTFGFGLAGGQVGTNLSRR